MDQLKGVQASFLPFAKRTRQWASEKFGGQDVEKTELPDEYLDLEKRVDRLRAVHSKLLNITTLYRDESYDYKDLKESFVDFGKNVSEKIQNLASAQSASDAQAAVTKPPAHVVHKTLNHALGRASLSGAELLGTADPLGNALGRYADAMEKVGDARLAQDQLIEARFNKPEENTLHVTLQYAIKARKAVNSARLTLDAAKATARSAKPEKQDAARVEVEQAEDAFVSAVEEATSVMKNVLDQPESIRNLCDLVAAQITFYQTAFQTLSDLAPSLDQIQVETESVYRNSRSEGGNNSSTPLS